MSRYTKDEMKTKIRTNISSAIHNVQKDKIIEALSYDSLKKCCTDEKERKLFDKALDELISDEVVVKIEREFTAYSLATEKLSLPGTEQNKFLILSLPIFVIAVEVIKRIYKITDAQANYFYEGLLVFAGVYIGLAAIAGFSKSNMGTGLKRDLTNFWVNAKHYKITLSITILSLFVGIGYFYFYGQPLNLSFFGIPALIFAVGKELESRNNIKNQ